MKALNLTFGLPILVSTIVFASGISFADDTHYYIRSVQVSPPVTATSSGVKLLRSKNNFIVSEDRKTFSGEFRVRVEIDRPNWTHAHVLLDYKVTIEEGSSFPDNPTVRVTGMETWTSMLGQVTTKEPTSKDFTNVRVPNYDREKITVKFLKYILPNNTSFNYGPLVLTLNGTKYVPSSLASPTPTPTPSS